MGFILEEHVVKIDDSLINAAFMDLKTALAYVNSNDFFQNEVKFKTADEEMIFKYTIKKEERRNESKSYR